MKLVLLYGPPGVGKLTVAKALQKLTNFKLLHNHLVVDLCSSIFDRSAPGREELNHLIRRSTYEIVSKSGASGFIQTVMYYAGPRVEECNRFYQGCVSMTKNAGDELCLVRLSCDQGTLERRVLDESRANTKKVNNVDKLRRILAEDLPCAEVPEWIAKGLHIDNTNLEPQETALLIQKFYNL